MQKCVAGFVVRVYCQSQAEYPVQNAAKHFYLEAMLKLRVKSARIFLL
jgi:hypothetical protein